MQREKAAGFVSLSVVLLVALGFVLGCSEFIILGVEPDVATSLNVPLASIGNLVGLFAGVYAVCTPTLGIVTGRVRRFTLLVCYLAVFCAGNLLNALAPSYEVLLVGRVVTASVSGSLLAVALTFVADLVDERHQPLVISWVYSGFSVASVLGVPAGTMVGELLGWNVALGIVFVLGLALAVGLVAVLPRTGSADTPAGVRQQLAIFAEPRILLTAAVTLFSAAGTYAFYTYISAYLEGPLGLTAAGASTFLMAMGVATLISNLSSGVVASRFGVPGLIPSELLHALLLGALALTSGSTVLCLANILLIGLLMYLPNSPTATEFLGIATRRHPGSETLASSLQPMSFNIGIALGSSLGGAVMGGPGFLALGPVGALAALASCGMGVAFLLVSRREAARNREDRESRTAKRGTAE